MMKAVKLTILTILTISLTFTFGCSQKFVDQKNTEDKADIQQQMDVVEPKNEAVELEIWSWFGFGDAIKQFEAKNGIKVKEKIFSFYECDEEYMKALANGTGPDVLVFDSNFFGQYTVDNILQNLLEEPFLAKRYQDQFTGWESGYSLDNMQLLSISYSTAPYITMYRADIMKENGFPSEPEEFGKFIEDPDNIIKIARKLKEQGKYIFQYPTDVTDIVGASMGHFDDDLNYIRGGDLFAKSIDMAQQAYDSELISNKNFWQDTGKKALQDEKLVMICLASYAMSDLEKYVPEQTGKWRVAKAPLGVSAWGSDSRLSINSQSEHKSEAWKLLLHIVSTVSWTDNVVPSYIPSQSNQGYLMQNKEFFGGQKVYPILVDHVKNMTQYKLTPLDKEAHDMYIKGIWQSLIYTENAYAEIERIRKEVEKEVGDKKNTLLE